MTAPVRIQRQRAKGWRMPEGAVYVGRPTIPDRAIAWLRDIRRTWTETDDEGRRGIVAALYERITVTSEGFVGARLTPQAQRHLVALAMPETVALARPEGREHRPATVTIPIEGRRDWRAVVRSA